MGRTKQNRPIKRRRVILEADDSVVAEEQTSLPEQNQVGDIELARAIDLLRKTPADQVEAAAAEAIRLELTRSNRWVHLRPPKTLLSPSLTTTSAITFNECDNHQVVQESCKQNNVNGDSVAKENLVENPSTGNKVTLHTIEDETATNSSETSSSEFSYRVPSWARGLGFARLATEDFEALQQLHQVIKDRINNKNRGSDEALSSDVEWASWSGSLEDPRRRAFGFLPGTWVSSHK